MINGIPARHDGEPFPGGTANFVGGERIEVTIDGVKQTIEFTAGVLKPAQVAEKINAGFEYLQLPRVATANGFDNRLTVEGWRGHGTGKVTVNGDPATLAKIGFPALKPKDGMAFGQVLSAAQTSHVTFRALRPGPGGRPDAYCCRASSSMRDSRGRGSRSLRRGHRTCPVVL